MTSPFPIPIQSKRLRRVGNKWLRVGAASMQGWRHAMEDADSILLSLPKHPNASFFGVFDGHGGTITSKILAEQFPLAIDKLKNFHDPVALTKAAMKMDKKLQQMLEKVPAPDGSTAVFVIIDKQTNVYSMTVGNVGDSRAVLLRGSKGVALTTDHKPNQINERNRIVAAGGIVVNDRIDGMLALSRAFGDREFKLNKTLGPEFQRVTAVPDVMNMKILEGDFLLLACDGIYENGIFTQESVGTWLQAELAKPNNMKPDGPDLALIVANLLDKCLWEGSTDNMTAILIQLANGEEYNNHPEYVPGPFYYGDGDSHFRKAYQEDAAKSGRTLDEALELLAIRLEKKQQENEVAKLRSIRLADQKGELITTTTTSTTTNTSINSQDFPIMHRPDSHPSKAVYDPMKIREIAQTIAKFDAHVASDKKIAEIEKNLAFPLESTLKSLRKPGRNLLREDIIHVSVEGVKENKLMSCMVIVFSDMITFIRYYKKKILSTDTVNRYLFSVPLKNIDVEAESVSQTSTPSSSPSPTAPLPPQLEKPGIVVILGLMTYIRLKFKTVVQQTEWMEVARSTITNFKTLLKTKETEKEKKKSKIPKYPDITNELKIFVSCSYVQRWHFVFEIHHKSRRKVTEKATNSKPKSSNYKTPLSHSPKEKIRTGSIDANEKPKEQQRPRRRKLQRTRSQDEISSESGRAHNKSKWRKSLGSVTTDNETRSDDSSDVSFSRNYELEFDDQFNYDDHANSKRSRDDDVDDYYSFQFDDDTNTKRSRGKERSPSRSNKTVANSESVGPEKISEKRKRSREIDKVSDVAYSAPVTIGDTPTLTITPSEVNSATPKKKLADNSTENNNSQTESTLQPKKAKSHNYNKTKIRSDSFPTQKSETKANSPRKKHAHTSTSATTATNALTSSAKSRNINSPKNTTEVTSRLSKTAPANPIVTPQHGNVTENSE